MESRQPEQPDKSDKQCIETWPLMRIESHRLDAENSLEDDALLLHSWNHKFLQEIELLQFGRHHPAC